MTDIILKSSEELEEIEKTLDIYNLEDMNLLDLNMLTIFLDVCIADSHDSNLNDLLFSKLEDCDSLFNDRLAQASEEEIESLDTSDEHTQVYLDFIKYVQSL